MPIVNHSQQLEVADRRHEVLRLRRKGWHPSDIAKHMRIDIRLVFSDISDELRKVREATVEYALDLRDLDLQRLDDIWAGLQDGIAAGDPAACAQGIRVLERRAKIFVYDAATKVDLNVGMVTAEEASKMSDDALKDLLLQLSAEAGLKVEVLPPSAEPAPVVKNVTPAVKRLNPPAPDYRRSAPLRSGDVIDG